MSEDESASGDKPELRIGSYRLLEPLGSGGMSSVYRAEHVETGHQVAVKVLPRSLAKNPTMLQRFLREAQSAEALEHPNVVTIYDRGVDQGRHYLVLEFVEGGDLHDRVRNEGPLEVADAVAVVRSVAEGLKYAAERGLIHRDIKPANLLVSPTGVVKIIDLGLALKAENEDERVTRDGTTVGTVDYMAPEQARDSRATSERSDIYSLGCTFYYLLTGTPPFAGGDIADKLSRHCTKPAPDPCDTRPSIPRILGAVVRKMMAKRPENRYQNYSELLAALRSIPIAEGPSQLVAHDEASDEDGIPLAPIESGIAVAGVARGIESVPAQGSALNLSELAGIEEESAPAPVRRSRAATPHSGRGPAPPPGRSEPLDAEVDEDDEEPLEDLAEDGDEPVEGLSTARVSPLPDPASRKKTQLYIFGGIGGVAGLLLLVVLVNLMIPASKTEIPSTPVEESVEAPITPEPEPAPAPVAPSPEIASAPVPPVAAPAPVRAPAPSPLPTPAAAPVAQTAPATAKTELTPVGSSRPSAAEANWIEPTDPAAESVTEPPIPPEVAARFPLPAWARAPIPQKVAGNYLKVRRITDPSNTLERSSLSSAFELIGPGTTELIDNGPFADSDMRMHGEARLIRSGQGRRGMIRLERPRLVVIRGQPALFFIEGKQLTLDGVDLIVDVQDLPREQTALFFCKGGSLTLNNCTITVVNAQNLPFSLIRAQGTDRPAQVRVEGTFIRGASQAAIEMTGGAVEIAVVRSVFVGGQGPQIVSTTSAPGGDRKLHIHQSVLASRGPILEHSSPIGMKPTPVSVWALGSTFARFRGDEPASLVFFHDDVGGEAKDYLNWLGEQNVYMGWNDWATMGSTRTVKVATLAAARTTWPGTDARSQEIANPWPVPPDYNRVIPEQMKTLANQSSATLASVATPGPYIFEKTIQEFPRPEIPTFVSPIPNEVQEGIGLNGFDQPRFTPPPPGFSPPPVAGVPPDASNAPVDPNAPPQPGAIKELLFDVAAKPWSGNLGAYLNDQVKPGEARVRVRVSGTGRFYFTPVKIAPGTSLEIVVETNRQTGGVPPEWIALKGATADALIDIKGGDLVMTGAEFVRDAGAKLKSLIRAEDSHLVLNHCRLRAMGPLEKGGGNLIVFRAPTTRPLPSHPWPFDKPFDKPACRIVDSVLITPGDVLTSELGRGIISLQQCAVAGANDFVLLPAKVARNRFEADLSIERCTIAAEKSFVSLGAWPGSTPGPDRPWVVNSRESAYMTRYNPPSRESVLLRAEPNSLAQGALFWQGSNDAYEVTNFTARTDKTMVQNAHPDVYRQWISIWGPNHFRSTTGPTSRSSSSIRLRDPLHPGNVTPGELALDPDYHPNRTELDLGVDLKRLQVTPGAERPGSPRRKS